MKKIIIKDRLGKSQNELEKISDDARSRYLKLKENLLSLTKDDIYNKIEVAKILREIKESKYFIFEEGCKSFSDYINKFNLVKSQVYIYLMLLLGIEKGALDYSYINDKGLQKSIEVLQDKKLIKPRTQNPLRPLRFQLRDGSAYEYYKENMKFTSWLLEKIFNEKIINLEELEQKYEYWKKEKK